MDFCFSIWRLGLGIRVCRHSWERDNFQYFTLKIWIKSHQLIIRLYRTGLSEFRYHIKLPFISVKNDERLRVVETLGHNIHCQVMPVVEGKVFGYVLGG